MCSSKTPKNLDVHQDVDTPYLIGIVTSFVSHAGRKVGVTTFVLSPRRKIASYACSSLKNRSENLHIELKEKKNLHLAWCHKK